MARYAVGDAPLPSFVQVNIENAGKNFTDYEIIRKAEELVMQNKINVARGCVLKRDSPLPGLSSLSGLNQYGWDETYWAGVSPQVSGVYGLGYEKYGPGFISVGLKDGFGNLPIWGASTGITYYDLMGSQMNPMCF